MCLFELFTKMGSPPGFVYPWFDMEFEVGKHVMCSSKSLGTQNTQTRLLDVGGSGSDDLSLGWTEIFSAEFPLGKRKMQESISVKMEKTASLHVPMHILCLQCLSCFPFQWALLISAVFATQLNLFQWLTVYLTQFNSRIFFIYIFCIFPDMHTGLFRNFTNWNLWLQEKHLFHLCKGYYRLYHKKVLINSI